MATWSSCRRRCKTLPKDLVFQILLRLPVESLMLFKSVCKSWRSLIESSNFVSQHTRHSEDDLENKLVILNVFHPSLFYLVCGYPTACPKFISVVDLQQSEQTDFNLNADDKVCDVKLIASFDGVVCLRHKLFGRNGSGGEDINVEEGLLPIDDMDVVSLWNPATKHVKILPPPLVDRKVAPRIHFCGIEYGFGFDANASDYKVVRLIVEDHVWGSKRLKSHVEVYSLNTDSWTVIDVGMPKKIRISSSAKRPFENGTCCWLGSDFQSQHPVALSFDFSKQVFEIIPMDEVIGVIPVSEVYMGNQILAFLREKLACIHWVPDSSGHESSLCKIWVWDECGVKKSWSKLYTFILRPQVCPMGFSVNGKIILRKRELGSETNLALYDPASQGFNWIPCQGSFYDVAVYKESLVSVKGANGETYRVDNKWKSATSTWDLTMTQIIQRSNKDFTEILGQDPGILVVFDEPQAGI